MQPRIIVFDTKPYDRTFLEKVNAGFGFELRFIENHLTAETRALAAGFDAACIFVNDSADATVIESLHEGGVKMIALRCAGYNNVDMKSAFGKIHVVRVPAYSPRAVAEHAVGLMLTLNRKFHRAYYRVRDNNFSINGLIGFDMYGKTIGVIGTGKIGKTAIEVLSGFGMNVLAFDKYPDQAFAEKTGVRYVDLDTLYATSDIITLHCPLTPENVHMINRGAIQKMKDGVMIINTGRGGLIDTRDLIAGLKTRKIGSAGLDVYEEETDYFFEDFSSSAIADDVLARLLTFPNVLVTSHQGFFTEEALANIATTTLENIRLFFEKGELPNEICYNCCEGGCGRKTTGKCF
jgi:D-lactate dehydrogenase